MTIKKLMMAAGAIDEPQVIAPSTNDWDYTFAQDEWPCAGNALGDNTSRGFFTSLSNGESGISSLITFDGDFEIEFTATTFGGAMFGIFEIAEDSKRRAVNTYGFHQASTESWSYTAINQGGGEVAGAHFHANDHQATSEMADGSVVKITRESGVIKFFDDGSVTHTFSQTSSNPVRFYMSSTTTVVNIDNILFTDTEKVQRDGIYDESSTTSSALGNYASGSIHIARRWKATRTGTLESLSFNVRTVTTGSNFHAELWTDDGTNPVSQVGGVTNTLTINSTGKKTFTFSTEPDVVKGQSYWAVIEDEDHASVNANIALWEQPIADIQDSGAGLHDTVTSITASKSAVYTMEAVINATEEPTPDHDTLLLIHSNTSDGSTTFADSSQFGRTITVGGHAQHDTDQNVLSQSSSIIFDGTGDYLTVPDSADFNFGTGGFTIEWYFRASSISTEQAMVKKGSGSSWSNLAWLSWLSSSKLYFNISNNGSSGITLVGSTTLSSDTWYHVALVRNGNTFTAYLNGTSDVSTTSSLTIVDSSYPVTVGIAPNLSTRPFTGHISEIRISRVARWDANFTPPSAPYP
jgi:hypothetical protein